MQVTSQGVTKVYQTVNNLESAGASITNVVQLYQGDTIVFLIRGYQNYTFTSIDATYYEIIVESLSALAVTTFSTLATSSFQVNTVQFGSGIGYINTGDLIANSISTIQINSGTINTTNLYVGATSSFNTIQFYGLDGLYKNTAIAEVTTVAGSQELLLFRGSTSTDRIRLQTTGDIRFESGVSQRIFSTGLLTQQSIPAMIIDSNSNVGIGIYPSSITNFKLDIAGFQRSQGLSSLQVLASSFQGDGSQLINIPNNNTVTSSIQGLGTFGYLSSPFKNFFLQSSFFINSQNLISQPSYGLFTIQTGSSYTSSPWGTQIATLQTTTNNYSQIVLNVNNQTLNYTGSNPQPFRITYTCGGNQNESAIVRPTLTMQVTSQGVTKVYQTVNNIESAGASITNVVQLYQGDTIIFLMRSYQNYTFTSIDATYYDIIIESISPLPMNSFSSLSMSSLSLIDKTSGTYTAISLSTNAMYLNGLLLATASQIRQPSIQYGTVVWQPTTPNGFSTILLPVSYTSQTSFVSFAQNGDTANTIIVSTSNVSNNVFSIYWSSITGANLTRQTFVWNTMGI